jgi:hypothetical protein
MAVARDTLQRGSTAAVPQSERAQRKACGGGNGQQMGRYYKNQSYNSFLGTPLARTTSISQGWVNRWIYRSEWVLGRPINNLYVD